MSAGERKGDRRGDEIFQDDMNNKRYQLII